MAIHLVYPHGERISCPDAIGRETGRRLRTRYDEVVLHDWTDKGVITPRPGDVLVGHPHYDPQTVFRRSLRQPGWRRILMMSPYAHHPWFVAFQDPYMKYCDMYLAITGEYWFSTVGKSLFRHWQPKMVHLDLAVDRKHFPVLKAQPNPAGKRRFVYIGHDAWYKNLSYLAELGQRVGPISWIGGTEARPGLAPLGRQDFRDPAAQALLASHDFLITVGSADPNPTTILESMSWGLPPVCTRESGYLERYGITNVPLNDLEGAVAILQRLQSMPDEAYGSMQEANYEALAAHFNWDRFAGQVVEAIESPARPALGPLSLADKIRIRYHDFRQPLSRSWVKTLVRPVFRGIQSLRPGRK